MKTVKLFETTTEDGARVRIVGVSESEPTTYTCLVRLEAGDSWVLMYVNEPAHREHAVDSPEAMERAAHAARSFVCDERERAEKMIQVPGMPGKVPTHAGTAMLAFGCQGQHPIIVWTDLDSLLSTVDAVGSAVVDDVGLDLGRDAPDAGVWLCVVREDYTPERHTADGYDCAELEFSVLVWGEPLWHPVPGVTTTPSPDAENLPSQTPGDA